MKTDDVTIWDCPRCSGKLVKRKGKHGHFLGCSNYPACTYTQKVEKEEDPLNGVPDAASVWE